MDACQFEGSPHTMGLAYGRALGDAIERNIRLLLNGEAEGLSAVSREEPHLRAWMTAHRDRYARLWPWLLQEMAGVAEGCGQSFYTILLLNLRAWQYQGQNEVADQCSNLVVTLSDDTIACAGALDDPDILYCGPVVFRPQHGYAFVSFPITGTCWGNRGVNSAGLAVGISSQHLPGLRPLPGAVNQDLALRVILQTAGTVEDVEAFCKAHPFTMNLTAVDAHGGTLCGHHTVAGWFEVSRTPPCAVTNHVADERIRATLKGLGATQFPESETTHPRLARLQSFVGRMEKRCTADEVRALFADTGGDTADALCPANNVAVTYANPMSEPACLWLARPRQESSVRWRRIALRTATSGDG